MSLEKVGISKNRDGGLPIGLGSYRILETFAGADEMTDDRLEDIRRKHKAALQDFPELAHKTVTIGRLDPDEDPAGRARFWNNLVLYPVDRRTSMVTVYHELAHLAIHELSQDGENVPLTSEEFCGIFGVSRMPAKHIDEPRIPYLGEPEKPREEWPGICQQALEYREENGANSHYIKKCREWLEE